MQLSQKRQRKLAADGKEPTFVAQTQPKNWLVARDIKYIAAWIERMQTPLKNLWHSVRIVNGTLFVVERVGIFSVDISLTIEELLGTFYKFFPSDAERFDGQAEYMTAAILMDLFDSLPALGVEKQIEMHAELSQVHCSKPLMHEDSDFFLEESKNSEQLMKALASKFNLEDPQSCVLRLNMVSLEEESIEIGTASALESHLSGVSAVAAWDIGTPCKWILHTNGDDPYALTLQEEFSGVFVFDAPTALLGFYAYAKPCDAAKKMDLTVCSGDTKRTLPIVLAENQQHENYNIVLYLFCSGSVDVNGAVGLVPSIPEMFAASDMLSDCWCAETHGPCNTEKSFVARFLFEEN